MVFTPQSFYITGDESSIFLPLYCRL